MRSVLLLAASALVLAACGAPLPERLPDAVGEAAAVATDGDAVEIAFVPDVGHEYFEGTTFVVDGAVPVAGAVDDAAEISAGDRLAVWVTVCAESFPVQCDVEAVRVEE